MDPYFGFFDFIFGSNIICYFIMVADGHLTNRAL